MLGKKYRVIMYDRNGVARIFQDHPNADMAETLAYEHAKEYITHNPSAGPLKGWIIEIGIVNDTTDEMESI